MRNVALVCAAVVIVLGAVTGTVLILTDGSSAGHRAGSSSVHALPSHATSSTTAAPRDPFTLADAGLRRLVAGHRPTAARTVVPMSSCPLAAEAALASISLRAAGVPTGGSRRGAVDVRDWSDSGDHGVAVTCRFTGPRGFYAAAFTHALRVGRAPIAYYDGPIAFAGGRLYRSVHKTTCAAYWTPPASDYVISVQFTAAEPVDVARCGAALRAVQPMIFRGLAKLAG